MSCQTYQIQNVVLVDSGAQESNGFFLISDSSNRLDIYMP